MLCLTQLDVWGYVNVSVDVTVYLCAVSWDAVLSFFILQVNANGKGTYLLRRYQNCFKILKWFVC
jgi:hypothetical protein